MLLLLACFYLRVYYTAVVLNREAATKAGFNVLRIISEPSATLLAYGIGQKDVSESWQVLSHINITNIHNCLQCFAVR